uniref:Uncharacterized protein n=1 Tax=Rhizophora mucronata TaxID=61149 RepID=A0A2P2P2A5_RHIMU
MVNWRINVLIFTGLNDLLLVTFLVSR